MGVCHESVTLIGAEDSVFNSDNLTEKAVQYIFDELGGFVDDYDGAKTYFDENKSEVMEWFGIEDIIGSCWTGDVYYRGISVEVGLNKSYQEEINHVLEYFNIKEHLDIHSGVYEY